jgi:hypothetical protein
MPDEVVTAALQTSGNELERVGEAAVPKGKAPPV